MYDALFSTHPYRFHSRDSILEEKDLGICADISSVRTPEYSVCSAEGLQSCPYTDTAFRFDLRIDGERVRTAEWEWLPNAMRRRGEARQFSLETVTAVIPRMHGFVMKVTCQNRLNTAQTVSVQVMYRGNPRYESDWQFSIPAAGKETPVYAACGQLLSCTTATSAFYLTSSLENLQMFPTAYLWEGEITIPASGSLTLYFSGTMGKPETARSEAEAAIGNYETLLQSSFDWFLKEAKRIEDHLPHLTSSNAELDRLYARSLVTYILCRWENPDLCVSPFFSTGSINGACMCSYLWDYCGGLMMHPLYDAAGNREMLKAYLRNDLTTSYALNPVTSGKVGPWYQVNQEKIICMVYYHVLFTGDKAFLSEQAGERTVLEWMLYHAYVCDDLSKPVELYDYGEGGKAHLELRRQYVYNGIMPDLNARRYMNYKRVYELTCATGKPEPVLLERMDQLKVVLKSLWNEDIQWYDFINKDGVRDVRYTVQMFKFLASPVIDRQEREGLISHLNEREFLSKFGLHSMSKLDEAYDQDDIDNGGGGICTHFTMQICAQLYEMGYDALATDILRRVYWWGERLPYLGDSCAANMIANREDTPLQGDISSVSAAQMMFFYIFGIRADFDGNISVTPVKTRPAEQMKIDNARLCGKVFSVTVDGNTFTVDCGPQHLTAAVGETIRF